MLSSLPPGDRIRGAVARSRGNRGRGDRVGLARSAPLAAGGEIVFPARRGHPNRRAISGWTSARLQAVADALGKPWLRDQGWGTS